MLGHIDGEKLIQKRSYESGQTLKHVGIANIRDARDSKVGVCQIRKSMKASMSKNPKSDNRKT